MLVFVALSVARVFRRKSSNGHTYEILKRAAYKKAILHKTDSSVVVEELRVLFGVKAVTKTMWFIVFSLSSLIGIPAAHSNPLEKGWVLQPDASSLNFQSIKNLTKVESSKFARFSGAILPDGQTEVEIDLASVDTKVDLRNVRMRFFLFETFIYPTAKISAQIDSVDLADLEDVRRKTLLLPFRLSLHGVEKDMQAEVAVTLLSDDRVSVSSTTPISIATAAFNLTEGVGRLEAAAEVAIIPSATVSFDFVFKRHSGEPLVDFPAFEIVEPGTVVTAAAETAPPADVNAPTFGAGIEAGETTAGDDPSNDVISATKFKPVLPSERLSRAECKIQYLVLTQLGQLKFQEESTEFSPATQQLLASIAETVRYCGEDQVEIGVHTFTKADSAGNQEFSDLVADNIKAYLASLGAEPSKLITVGYGDAAPRVPKEIAMADRFNQRIELSPISR